MREAVEKEMKGPGTLLGHCSLHKKVREVHRLKVPRNLVYNIIVNITQKVLRKQVVWDAKMFQKNWGIHLKFEQKYKGCI